MSLCRGERQRTECLLTKTDRKRKVLCLVKMLPALAMEVFLRFDKMDKWLQNAIAELPMKALRIRSPTLLPRCKLLAQTRLLSVQEHEPQK